MFNTMTMTKIGGAIFGALLFFLLGNWAAGALYSTAVGGHGDEEHAQGYVIAVITEEEAGDAHADEAEAGADSGETAEAGEAEPEVVTTAAADPEAGAKVFKKCKACHKLEEGVKAVGPDLYGIVGRAVASRDFGYSNPMQAVGGIWDPALLDTYLTDPKGMVPGTKMTFKGLSKPEDRANVIAYLATIGG